MKYLPQTRKLIFITLLILNVFLSKSLSVEDNFHKAFDKDHSITNETINYKLKTARITQSADSSVCGKTENSNSVSSSTNNGNWTILSNNCPGYDWTSGATVRYPLSNNIAFTIPLNPVISTTKTYIGMWGPNGTNNTHPTPAAPIGITVNGIVIYPNIDATLRNAKQSEGNSFDKCDGHVDPKGNYHYHMEPNPGCVFTDTPGEHSPLFGIMQDGIPIFGQLGDKGTIPILDECGGHVDGTYPFYHYHLPYNRSLPFTVTCLAGCIYNQNGNSKLNTTTLDTCPAAKTQYDYSQVRKLFEQANAGKSATSLTLYLISIFSLIVMSLSF
jgi:hypothetical protein